MAMQSIRRSQAITPFGVGAVVDFPTQSLMAAGLDQWPNDPKQPEVDCRIEDARLAKRLNVDYFRSPPPPPQKNHNGDYLPFVRFPLWYFCPRCRAMKEAKWNDTTPSHCSSSLPPLRTGAPACSTLPDKKRWRMVPLRFVVACENGHIDDFPWILWAHSQLGKSLADIKICSNPSLRFKYTGKAGLMGLQVKCENCDAKARTLMGAAGSNALKGLSCSGNRPWLGPHGKEICNLSDPPRMLQRGATNLYFPKIASSILIPPFSDRIRKVIDEPRNWEALSSSIKEDGTVDESGLQMFAKLKSIDMQYLKRVVHQKLSGAGIGDEIQDEIQYRFSEYKALMEDPGDKDQEFITEKPDIDRYEEDFQQYINQVVLVKKLAETRALAGFSRITPPIYREYDCDDQLQLSLEKKSWLPGIRVYGEGIFFTVKKSAITKWLTGAIGQRYDEIYENHKRIYEKLGREPREIPSKFFLLHTLAHILIRRLSYECGYGSSSIRERIYCWEGDKCEMNGILLYTAAGDSAGTMGGLVEQGKAGRFELLLQSAIEDALWCSSDPLCIESRGQGIDSLNLAACHACTLLPETSCEEGNRFLDRAALVGIPGKVEGFFCKVVEEVMSGIK